MGRTLAKALKHTPFAVLAGMLLVVAPSALAGSIVIEERSIIDIEEFRFDQAGKWTLSTPAGTKVSNHKDVRQTVPNASEGQYLLKVMPPEGAHTRMTFSKDGTILQTVEATEFSFLFSGQGTIDVLLEYSYSGTATIDSDPQGVPFEFTGPQGYRRVGVTPTVLENLPPFTYTVNFGIADGCRRQKPLTRELNPSNPLKFFGDFDCEETAAAEPKLPEPPAETEETQPLFPFPFLRLEEEPSEPTVTLHQTVSRVEGVAGGTVHVTIGVRNISTKTLENITVTEMFDSTLVSLPDILPEGGKRELGNLTRWDIPRILAGQSWSVTLPLSMNETLQEGDRVSLTARASGSNVRGRSPDSLTTTVTVGIAAMPPTGVRTDTLALVLSATIALLATHSHCRRRHVEMTA